MHMRCGSATAARRVVMRMRRMLCAANALPDHCGETVRAMRRVCAEAAVAVEERGIPIDPHGNSVPVCIAVDDQHAPDLALPVRSSAEYFFVAAAKHILPVERLQAVAREVLCSETLAAAADDSGPDGMPRCRAPDEAAAPVAPPGTWERRLGPPDQAFRLLSVTSRQREAAAERASAAPEDTELRAAFGEIVVAESFVRSALTRHLFLATGVEAEEATAFVGHAHTRVARYIEHASALVRRHDAAREQDAASLARLAEAARLYARWQSANAWAPPGEFFRRNSNPEASQAFFSDVCDLAGVNPRDLPPFEPVDAAEKPGTHA